MIKIKKTVLNILSISINRSDGKDCLKFYTDPDFFFNIWCNELIKDNETRKKEKKNRRVIIIKILTIKMKFFSLSLISLKVINSQ